MSVRFVMMALAATSLLAGCAHRHDNWGNRYPPRPPQASGPWPPPAPLPPPPAPRL